MINLFCVVKNEETEEDEFYDITGMLTDLKWSGDKSTTSRKIDFSLISSFNLELSSMVVLYEDDVEIFRGFVHDRNISNPSPTIEYTAFDYAEKLNKIKVSYNVKNKTVGEGISTILLKYGFTVGEIGELNHTVSRLFIDVSLYEVINTLLSLQSASDSKQYSITSSFGLIDIKERGIVESDISMIDEYNIISTSTSETLSGLVNKVIVVNESGSEIHATENTEDLEKHGLFQAIYKVQENDDYRNIADDMLKTIEHTLSLEGFGDKTCITHNKIVVIDPKLNIKAFYYIDSDTHTIKFSKHIVSLKLILDNVMKVSDAGEK